MKLFIKNQCTQTPGAVNLVTQSKIEKQFIFGANIDNINGIQNGIKSYEDYLQYYNNGEKRGKKRLYNKINDLKNSLIEIYGKYVDPIKYIIKLYYIDNLPIIDVGNRLNELGWGNRNESSIEKTFKQTFGWELRSSTGSEISKKKRNYQTQIENAQEKYKEINQEKYEILKNFFNKRIKTIVDLKIEQFDYKSFEDLNKTGKILYLLYFFYGINRKEIIELKKNNIGARVMANYINQYLESIINKLNINLTIFSKDIQILLNELN